MCVMAPELGILFALRNRVKQITDPSKPKLIRSVEAEYNMYSRTTGMIYRAEKQQYHKERGNRIIDPGDRNKDIDPGTFRHPRKTDE